MNFIKVGDQLGINLKVLKAQNSKNQKIGELEIVFFFIHKKSRSMNMVNIQLDLMNLSLHIV